MTLATKLQDDPTNDLCFQVSGLSSHDHNNCLWFDIQVCQVMITLNIFSIKSSVSCPRGFSRTRAVSAKAGLAFVIISQPVIRLPIEIQYVNVYWHSFLYFLAHYRSVLVLKYEGCFPIHCYGFCNQISIFMLCLPQRTSWYSWKLADTAAVYSVV